MAVSSAVCFLIPRRGRPLRGRALPVLLGAALLLPATVAELLQYVTGLDLRQRGPHGLPMPGRWLTAGVRVTVGGG